MLKKLVRYGNSNALVLDKAILELLNIAEGSIVKISTDGRSIILTPHQEAAQVVSETFTSQDAMQAASVQESLKHYKNLSDEQKAAFGKELLALTKKHSELMMSLGSNEQLQQEFANARMACAGDQAAFMVQYKKLIAQYVPEIKILEDAMLALHEQCNILSGGQPTENIQVRNKDMEEDMAAVFKKHQGVQMTAGTVMSSPEYQHRAQLIAEKYQGNMNSAEFLKEIKQLMYEFCPEMEQIHKDLDAVAKKYNQRTL